MREKTAGNTGFASAFTPIHRSGLTPINRGRLCKLGALCLYSSVVLVDSFVLPKLTVGTGCEIPLCAKPHNVLGHFMTAVQNGHELTNKRLTFTNNDNNNNHNILRSPAHCLCV